MAGIFHIIFLSGGPLGLIIMLLITALSITAAYLVFDHVITLRRKELIPEGLESEVRGHLAAGRLVEAQQVCQRSPSLLAFLLIHGIAEIEGGWPAIEKALEDATADQAARLMRKVEYLSVIGNLAPMLGLLGTVTGMILAFQQVAATQGGAGAAELAEGIYQALVTTVGGLVVAIPSLAAFAIFRNRVDGLIAEAAYTAQAACRPLKRSGVTGRQSPPRPPSATA